MEEKKVISLNVTMSEEGILVEGSGRPLDMVNMIWASIESFCKHHGHDPIEFTSDLAEHMRGINDGRN